MSDLKSKQGGVRFVPVAEAPPGRPSDAFLVFGVLFPALVILVEMAMGLCAQFLFDPLATPGHVIAVWMVPLANAAVWAHLRYRPGKPARWVAFANGAALAVATFYALLFAPLMPLAVLGVMAYGIGLLAFGPLSAALSAGFLRRRLFRAYHGLGRAFAGGLVVGAAWLVLLDLPPAVTRVGMSWAVGADTTWRERGVRLLRAAGSEEHLRRLCYDAFAREPGLMSWIVGGASLVLLDDTTRGLVESPAEAREVYYRVYGQPFNVKPAPARGGRWARFNDFAFDNDLGGSEVGGRVSGLTLAASRIDGSISAGDAVAYLEWTMEFRNASPQPREARLEFALPPGGVVSRASLWVNGEEREAAYGGRGQVRAAYQQVAVRERRDPLLVTTKGADRVLAQAFPVPAGGTIKFKIGITAPLERVGEARAAGDGTGRLTLPAIVNRNFSFAADVPHTLWIEAKTPLSASTSGLTTVPAEGGVHRLRGAVNDEALSRTRQSITVAGLDTATPRAARIGEGETVRQEWSGTAPRPGAMMLVIDASVKAEAARGGLMTALDAIPEGAKVGVTLAKEPPETLAIAPWTAARKAEVRDLIGKADFAGGRNNGPALAGALEALEAHADAVLLWVHGPQPVVFRDSADRLEQVSGRLTRYPGVALYATEPGPNQLLPDTPWAWSARMLPRTGDVAADLSGYLAGLWSEARGGLAARTEIPAGTGNLAPGSEHIARLWARDRVLTLMRENPEANREAATALAARYRLVTPVSGAVVLETQAQYEANRLTPAGQASVPTVPEPHEWALMLLAGLALLWLARRRFPGMGAAR